MTASRMILQSGIVLVACLVGFAMGRWGATPGGPALTGESRSDQPTRASGGKSSATGVLFGSLPVTIESEIDGTSGTGTDQQQGPDRQFFPEALRGQSRPQRLPETGGAEPIKNLESAATAAQIDFLIEQKLPAASQSDKRLWAEELRGLPLESVREILQLKQSLESIEGLTDPPETGRSREADPSGCN